MRRAAVAFAGAALLALPAASAAAEPKLTEPKDALAASLKCTDGVDDATRTPLMLVTGTGASGDEAYAIGKGAFDHQGMPVCWVNFPDHTTADIQRSVQYLVAGLRVMHRRAGRRVAVFGISQGGLLPRIALTYWPSLRRFVDDVISAAGTHHGTTAADFTNCGRDGKRCVPAAFQQARGSLLLRALNARLDETPGATSWTTVRSATDETVQPQTGPAPTSSLAGATNVLIQAVCPGRETSHIGTALDSVTGELISDAIAHPGPAKPSRLPDDVCSHRYATGLDEESTDAVLGATGGLLVARYQREPKVGREPLLRAWVNAE